jgi:hypothetical protein
MPSASVDAAAMIGSLTDWITIFSTSNPAVFVGGALFLALMIFRVAGGRAAPKDPTRMFTANQRSEGFARAGGRCEFETLPFIRCRKPAHHGDHHYPWSKGGATSMSNFTAACVRCNTSKGAKLPGFLSTVRMEARRRKYFPAGVPVKAGQRFTQR